MLQALKKILLVEDEEDIRLITQMSLERGNMEVNACSSGLEALDHLNYFHPDLILLDIMMPEMDGMTVFAELRKLPQTQNTPVVFMTAKTQRKELETYLKMGAIEVIPKPFDPLTLVNHLKQIWSDLDKPEKGLK